VTYYGSRINENYRSIDFVHDIFGQDIRRICKKVRNLIFKEFAKSNCYGIIFTYAWNYNSQKCADYVEYISNIFKHENGEIYHVELVLHKRFG